MIKNNLESLINSNISLAITSSIFIFLILNSFLSTQITLIITTIIFFIILGYLNLLENKKKIKEDIIKPLNKKEEFEEKKSDILKTSSLILILIGPIYIFFTMNSFISTKITLIISIIIFFILLKYKNQIENNK